jgi:hypothetical protein
MLRSGWGSPELSDTGGIIEFPEEPLAYFDVTLGRTRDEFESVRPLDRLFQGLVDQSYKCIGTSEVVWRRGEGVATSAIFGTKSYVIRCDGNCEGLTYRSAAGGAHYGKPLPYPVVRVTSRSVGVTRDLVWSFARQDSAGPAPRIRIHTWSNQLGDYGGRCSID